MKRKRSIEQGNIQERTFTPIDAEGEPEEKGEPEENNEPQTKKKKPLLVRTPSTLSVQEHKDLPPGARVLLRPTIELGGAENDTVQRLVISRLQRTPSPFGSRMGDHTVAWQAVVDAMHARLHGLRLERAVAVLRDEHDHASAWMPVRDSFGRRLLDLLDDVPFRIPRLEDASYQVRRHLDGADVALLRARAGQEAEGSDKGKQKGEPSDPAQQVIAASRALELAVAYHLAYLNYLPYATVPARSTRGSTGGTEGHHRDTILAVERLGRPSDLSTLDIGEIQLSRVRKALWGLFSFEAALREAPVELAVRPKALSTLTDQYYLLTDWSDQRLQVQMELHEDIGSGRSARSRKTHKVEALEEIVTEIQEFRADISGGTHDIDEETEGSADEAQETDPFYEEIMRAAQEIRDCASMLITENGATLGQKRKQIETHRGRIARAMKAAADLIEDLEQSAANAPGDAATILGRLLHEHHQTVATAYPLAVAATDFLDSDTTFDRLGEEIRAAYPPKEEAACPPKEEEEEDETAEDPVETLVARVRKVYEELGGRPAPSTENALAGDSHTAMLTVRYDPSQTDNPLTVNGRAPAPPAVSGMGSHTTAWTAEVTAVTELVRSSATPADVAKTLRKAVIAELDSDVMKLDWLLPPDQLTGGQLVHLFDAAETVLRVTGRPSTASGLVEDSVAAYLTFRNLLPYATVDPGDRGGHGERSGKLDDTNFDRKALVTAAGLQADLLEDSDTRAQAAATLQQQSAALLEDDRWGTPDELRSAVVSCARRLRTQARALMRFEKQDFAELIVSARTQEHRRITEGR